MARRPDDPHPAPAPGERDSAYDLFERGSRMLAERHPGVFVPRYTMVSFQRVPYVTAFERGKLQRALLIDATQGKTCIEDVDLAAADAMVRERLTPLPPA